MLAKGNTAIEGRSGRGGSTLPSSATVSDGGPEPAFNPGTVRRAERSPVASLLVAGSGSTASSRFNSAARFSIVLQCISSATHRPATLA